MKQRFGLLALALCLLCSLNVSTAAADFVCPDDAFFCEDFEDPSLPGISETQGYSAYGFGNYFARNLFGSMTLYLDELPAHTSLDLNFLLAIIDSWDGETGRWSPDYFDVLVDGVTVFHGAFDNTDPNDQYYNPRTSETTLVYQKHLGFTSIFKDSAYDMGKEPLLKNIPHTKSTLVISWRPRCNGWIVADESWAIDNVEIILKNNRGQALVEEEVRTMSEDVILKGKKPKKDKKEK